jgi:hypothetical protein
MFRLGDLVIVNRPQFESTLAEITFLYNYNPECYCISTRHYASVDKEYVTLATAREIVEFAEKEPEAMEIYNKVGKLRLTTDEICEILHS